jgi:hypothetical protein
MTIDDESDRVPPEAKNFTAPPDKQDPQPESSGDASTLAEFLESAREGIGQLRADTDTINERFSEKWRKRAATLEALQPTGNLAEDAKALFQASQTDPSRVNSRYNLNEENGLAQYLGDLRNTAAAAVGTEHDKNMQAYYEALARTIERILTAHKTAENRHETPAQD